MNLHLKLLVDYYIGGALQALLKPPVVLLGKILKRDHNLAHAESVTFIKMLGGGSLVIAYPALVAIKNARQVKSLRLVTTPAVKPFAEILGVFDEIIVIRDSSPVYLLLDSLTAVRKVFRCGAIVDLEIHSRLTTVFSLVTCAKNRIGFYTGISFWRQKLATHLLFCNITNGIYYFYDQIALLFGAEIPDMGHCIPRFRSTLGVPARSRDTECLRLALAPCCSDLGRERMLHPKEWIEILQRRLAMETTGRKVEIWLMGGRGDHQALEELSALILAAFPQVATVNLAGKTSLAESVRKLSEVEELFCIDSALLHFARLQGIPTVSFWGPTDPASRLRESEFNRDQTHYFKLPCSPCVHVAQEAPCGGNNICMRFAVNPDARIDINQPWIVADDSVTRFGRNSAP